MTVNITELGAMCVEGLSDVSPGNVTGWADGLGQTSATH